jgi:putative addiction module component (TIGR02574 family)
MEPFSGTSYIRHWTLLEQESLTMDATIDMLEAAALSLPEAERARLAAALLASLDQDPRIEQAWIAEVRERIAAYDRGEITAVPADEVLARAREIVGL